MIQVDGSWQYTRNNAIGRWAGIGPYYAMFPNNFAFNIVSKYTNQNDWILDPFAGRFSSVYAATSQGRNGIGIEINPVGWVYGQAKLHPVAKEAVKERLREIGRYSRYFGIRSRKTMPEFFSFCFAPQVLSFLLASRNTLDWKNNSTDTTLMALILVFLHAKLGSGLSNQMRQSKAMAPDYSVRWWIKNEMVPPNLNPIKFMEEKIEWRYKKGVPTNRGKGIAILADSTTELGQLVEKINKGKQPRFRMIFTSPPYYDVTHYHYDQWLRYWMLGGPNWPSKAENKHRGRFSSKVAYQDLLDTVFKLVSQAVTDDAIIYVRTDKREFTLQTTRNTLKKYFPTWKIKEFDQPVNGHTQTALFGDSTQKPGEVDLVLQK